jgi:F-box/leucine-rich repeat protein 2/20
MFYWLQKIDVSRCDCVSSYGLSALIRGHNGLLQIDAGYTISVSQS